MSIADDFDRLIDHDIINGAAVRLTVAVERLSATAVDLNAATAAHSAAEDASRHAAAGDGDPMQAEHALEAAARMLAVAVKVHAAAEAAQSAAHADIHPARERGWRPVYVQGIRLRLQATKKADVARGILAEAEAEFNRATAVLNAANPAGLIYREGHQTPFGSYQDELKLWAVPNSWWTGRPLEIPAA
jgi:hypothetical protein